MLYVILKGGRELGWHTGEKIYLPPQSEVVEVQADGHELEWIKENFNNIPYHKLNRVQNWSGDMARFIAQNLPRD